MGAYFRLVLLPRKGARQTWEALKREPTPR